MRTGSRDVTSEDVIPPEIQAVRDAATVAEDPEEREKYRALSDEIAAAYEDLLDPYGGYEWEQQVREARQEWSGNNYKIIQQAAAVKSGDAQASDYDLDGHWGRLASDWVDLLDEAMMDRTDYGVPKGTPLYRGFRGIENVDVGDVLKSDGTFVATTLDPREAMAFSNTRGGLTGVPKKPLPVLRIRDWTEAAPTLSVESELLLPRGTNFRVTGRDLVTYGDGFIEVLDCEIVDG
jgi:hypothetical protein